MIIKSTHLHKKMYDFVILNSSDLPRFVPRQRYFMYECSDLLDTIKVQLDNGFIHQKTLSDLYLLNTYLCSKLGKNIRTH